MFMYGGEKAYGAVAYLRFWHADLEVSVKPLVSKSRLAPLNNTTLKTIPRIELCSAKLGVELAQKLLKELDFTISRCFYWNDSITVLCYSKNDSANFKRFVDNKVCFIRNFTDKRLVLRTF